MIELSPIQERALAAPSGSRQERYRFYLADRYGGLKNELIVSDASISCDNEKQVKRMASFTFREEPCMNWLTDRIIPVMEIQLEDGSWASWRKGRYLPSVPTKQSVGGETWFTVDCYDETQLLLQDRFVQPLTLRKGTLYTDAIQAILATADFPSALVTACGLRLPVDLLLDDSKSKLEYINDLSAQIGHEDIAVNDSGIPVSLQYRKPLAQHLAYTYRADSLSVIEEDVSVKANYADIPNVFKRTMSRPELPALTSTVINDDPTDPFSTVYRGITIVDAGTVELIGGQEELDAYVARLAFEARQVGEESQFTTLNMPHHEQGEILSVEHPMLTGLFKETAWSMELRAGGQMEHTVRRVRLL